MLDAGVAREVARMVLPVSIYSSAYVTMNARCVDELPVAAPQGRRLALPAFPQREIEMVAERYEEEFAD